MKTLITKFRILTVCFVVSLLTMNSKLYASKPVTNNKSSLTVLHVDAQNIKYTPQQLGNLVRLEVERLDSFDVMDRYDVVYLVEKHNLKIDNCYGKICLVEIGEMIDTDKMLSGSVELYGETIILTLRLIDVKSKTIERTNVREFLDLQNDMQDMIRISVRELFGMYNNEELVTRLTKKFNYENSTNNPDETRLKLSGPRMGFTSFVGPSSKYITDS